MWTAQAHTQLRPPIITPNPRSASPDLHLKETALHWACRNIDLEMARTLLSLGADVHKRDSFG